jgi:hypothetical protein
MYLGIENFTQPNARERLDQMIFSQFSKNGYVTAHSHNMCQRYSLPILSKDYQKYNLQDYNFDHESMTFSCDPNYQNPENSYSMMQGPYSIRRRCLYGLDAHDYILEYGEKFWDSYPTENKLLHLEFIDAHEGTAEVVKYLDSKLENFFKSLKNL